MFEKIQWFGFIIYEHIIHINPFNRNLFFFSTYKFISFDVSSKKLLSHFTTYFGFHYFGVSMLRFFLILQLSYKSYNQWIVNAYNLWKTLSFKHYRWKSNILKHYEVKFIKRTPKHPSYSKIFLGPLTWKFYSISAFSIFSMSNN